MTPVYQKYLVNEQGHKEAVIISMDMWNQILEALEELDAVRSYDEAKKQPSELLPFEQAIREIA